MRLFVVCVTLALFLVAADATPGADSVVSDTTVDVAADATADSRD